MLHERSYRNNMNPHAPLSDAELQRAINAIFQVMRETGVKFDHNPKGMDIFSDAGCDISADGIVKFPTDLVRSCIDSVGKSVKIWNRPGNDYIELSINHTIFTSNFSAPNFEDIDTGERRACTNEDYILIGRVSDALSEIDGVQVAYKISEIDRFLTVVENSTKPQLIVCEDKRALEASIELAAAVRGGMEQLREKPFFLASVSAMPLHYSKNDTDQMMILLENDIPLGEGTTGIGGANTPVTIVGNVVNCFATDFAALVLSQLVKKGSFCTIGSTITFMDPTTGNLGAMNETTLVEMVKYQIGRYFGLPLYFANAGLNLGKVFNQDTVLGIAVTMTAGIFSQATCCSYLGGMDGLQSFSLHALMLCNELIGMARRMWQGVRVDDETLALELTHKVGPGGDFLTEMHTAQYCRKELSPIRYFKSKTFEAWEEEGRKDIREITDDHLREILATHTIEPLPEEVRDQLKDIFKKYGA